MIQVTNVKYDCVSGIYTYKYCKYIVKSQVQDINYNVYFFIYYYILNHMLGYLK